MSDDIHPDIPGPYAKAPVPLTRDVLIRWLNARHAYHIHPSARMADVVNVVNARYAPHTVVNTADGEIPATWDVWAHTVKHEKRLRGGQKQLF